jgi:Putative zinc-finger
MTHPEELLAEYVDGSLEQDERAVVETHLEGCERCRAEVAGARRARSALAALAEVELPEGFRPDRRAGRVRPAGVRHERLRRTAVAAGAVAASIAALVGLAVLIGHGGGAGKAPTSVAGSSGETSQPPTGTVYSAARVNALADSLASTRREANFGAQTARGAGGHAGSNPVPAPQAPKESNSDNAVSSATLAFRSACIRDAVSIPSGRRIRPNIVGTFDGTPAYIGAYRVDGSIRVVVVSRKECSVLYSTTRPIR